MSKIALIGNPNVGKSTIFNTLTGKKEHTGNWPGKTVGNAVSDFTYNNKTYTIYDLPGTYSLISHSKEEEIAKNFIYSNDYDLALVVCDAVCLERNLNLVLQILKITNNVIICVNLIDEATKKKIFIDLNKLSDILGVPVVGTAARNNIGINNLLNTIEDFKPNKDKKNKLENSMNEEILKSAEDIAKQVVTINDKNYTKKDRKIDKLLTSKLTGIPIMLILLLTIFWITITGANYPSSFLYNILFKFEDLFYNLLISFNINKTIVSMLIHGIYRTTSWVISVMLPPMAIFFPLFAILEDYGILPRIAFNMDKIFKKCSACGKQALTMCMGFGCNAAGVTSTRIIDSKRERLIAIITNNFVPCNGRFPCIISIITMFFVGFKYSVYNSILSALFLTLVILFGIMMTFLISKFLSKTFLKGKPAAFALELPPYRKPQFFKLILTTLKEKTLKILVRAISVAAPAGLVIWIFSNISINNITLLNHITYFLDPLGKAIGLDGTILMAFILGFPANEIVIPIMLMGYLGSNTISDFNNLSELKNILTTNGWTIKTAICTILFSLMHFPCSTTCITIKKETNSFKWMFVSILIPTICGFIICFIVSNILNIFI